MADHLAHMMLVQVLRAVLAANDYPATGWLAGLADAKLGRAIGAMHAEPARRWTLDALAETAGMSCSSFAMRFKAVTGNAPLDHLLRWRMHLAAHALRRDGRTVSSIAYEAGYEPESAFSHAFKRVTGHAPTHYRTLNVGPEAPRA